MVGARLMLFRILVFIFAAVSFSPAGAQDAIVATIMPRLDALSRAETLRTIRHAESSILYDMHALIRRVQVTDLENLEKQVPGFFNRAAFCYRALTLLAEKKGFPNIASLYRARADIFSDRTQGKINPSEYAKREAESERTIVRALTLKMASLEKDAPPNQSTKESLTKLGGSLGQSIVASAAKEFGPVPTPQTGPTPLVGYGQVSRSDGLKTFFVAGTFPNTSECERVSKIFSDNWVNSAKAAGHSGKLESLTCDASVPRGTEYESLRHGTAAKHYIFFTERLRLMFVHERGTLDYERAMCERMRDAMKATDPNATCDAPKQGKQAAPTPDTADKDVSIGYGRVSRGDGLNVFFVLGSFPTRKKCEDAKKTFGDTVLSLTKSSPHSVKLETSICEASVPSSTYYEALRNGNPVKHYTLFHPDMTVMFMHPRGAPDEERVLCERTRDATKSTAPNAECYRPSPAVGQPAPAQPSVTQPSMTQPSMKQDAIEKAASQLKGLSRSEILRGIKGAEKEVTKDLEMTVADARFLTDTEKDMTALYKRAGFCYRALTSLLEKNSFADIAVTYRARAQLYDDALTKKIGTTQLETSEKENDVAKERAVTAELTALDKKAPPKESTLRSLQRLGPVLGQVILAAVREEQGDVPYVHTFNQGMIALKRDDYASVAKLLRPLAERGDPRAQFWIGYMHQEGKGLPRDLAEAVKWLQRSAERGERFAQYRLGSTYASGAGIAPDLGSAYMWFTLAASQGDEDAAKARDQLKTRMTAEQVTIAKKRASDWKPVKR
jgi:uncharacterized protein